MSIATDHALATIASILHRPDLLPGADTAGSPLGTDNFTADKMMATAGYSKTGPGPMSAIRFKWTVRRGDDGFYVDETVGASSIPVAAGPMSVDAAIKLVDARAAEAQARFEALKSEMIGVGRTGPLLPTGVDGT